VRSIGGEIHTKEKVERNGDVKRSRGQEV